MISDSVTDCMSFIMHKTPPEIRYHNRFNNRLLRRKAAHTYIQTQKYINMQYKH